MKYSNFWIDLLSGNYRTTAEFKEALRQLRIERDAPDTTKERRAGTYNAPLDTSLKALSYPSICAPSENLMDQWARADWQNTDRRIAEFSARLIEKLRRDLYVPMYVHCAYRTKAEQDRAFVQGNSKLKWPTAAHPQGAAVDIIHSKYSWDLTRNEWNVIGQIGKEVHRRHNNSLHPDDKYQIVWGGDWKFYDPAHWEIQGWQKNIRTPDEKEPIRLTPTKIIKPY